MGKFQRHLLRQLTTSRRQEGIVDAVGHHSSDKAGPVQQPGE